MHIRQFDILKCSSCQPLGVAVVHLEKDKAARGWRGFNKARSQCEQMALINAEAPDRISLDGFHFLNDTFVCKCIVCLVVTSS